jgi:hypothetical protein
MSNSSTGFTGLIISSRTWLERLVAFVVSFVARKPRPFLDTPKRSRVGEPITDWEQKVMILHGRRYNPPLYCCPDCEDGQPLYEGPEGGMAINMLCRCCGARFNIYMLGLPGIHGERLESLPVEPKAVPKCGKVCDECDIACASMCNRSVHHKGLCTCEAHQNIHLVG